MSATETSQGRVLIVDGDPRRAEGRVEQLQLDGWQAQGVTRESAVRSSLVNAEIVVLGDLGGSAAPSLQILRDVRAGRVAQVDRTLRAIVFADTEPQILSAYAAGADLTLPRPASSMLVTASVAALKRRRWRADDRVSLGRLEVDRAGRTAAIDGQSVKLTAREFDLIDAMAQAPGRVFTRDELSRELWGTPNIRGSRTLDQVVMRTAKKLRGAGADPAVIQNVWGRGYKLTEGAER